MRTTPSLILAVTLLCTLDASAVSARVRRIALHTGAHAQTMTQIYQANQQHNAVINQVQQNINNNLHR